MRSLKQGWCGFVGAALLLTLAGCSAASTDPSDDDWAGTSQPLSEIVGAKGVRLTLVGKAKWRAVKPGELANREGAVVEAAAEATTDVNQLADELRGVVLSGDYEYRQASADLELARRVIAARGTGQGTGSVSNQGSAPDAAPKVGRSVIGSDGRSYVSNNTGFPWRTFVWSEAQCTGTMIGPGTMVTAAHCVYDTINNAWYKVFDTVSGVNRWPRYAPGVDGRDATPAPYGWQQCYDVAVPGGYANSTSETDATALLYDYAVLDFSTRCGRRPGDATGWMGTWFYTAAGIQGLRTYLYGYPSVALGVGRYTGDIPNHYAELWGMSGSAGTTYIGIPSTELQTTIDSYAGESGAAYYVNDTDYRVIGIHHGGNSTINAGRFYDVDVFNFWDAHSPYPQQQ